MAKRYAIDSTRRQTLVHIYRKKHNEDTTISKHSKTYRVKFHCRAHPMGMEFAKENSPKNKEGIKKKTAEKKCRPQIQHKDRQGKANTKKQPTCEKPCSAALSCQHCVRQCLPPTPKTAEAAVMHKEKKARQRRKAKQMTNGKKSHEAKTKAREDKTGMQQTPHLKL